MIHERGQEDWDSEFGRFPRLFEGHESIPSLTYPTVTFKDRLTIYMGKRRVDLIHVGRAHTAGDIVVWVPDQQIMMTGDIVEYHSACYCGDGHFTDWQNTLDNIAAFDPAAIVPGRGAALVGKKQVNEAITNTSNFVRSTFLPASQVAARGGSLKEAWDGVRELCDPNSRTTPFMNIACHLMWRVPMMKLWEWTPPVSGQHSAIWKCGKRCKGNEQGNGENE